MRGFLAIVVAALVVGGTAAGATTAPSLRVTSANPFRIAGQHFRATEHVRVTLTAKGESTVRRATASPTGSFLVGFGTVAVDRCSGFTVRAVGSRGSEAVLKHLPLPACMPAKTG
jgi:hypothetical protein